MSKTAHIISHTHWDREWYLPYETHHLMLVENIDKLLDVFNQNSGFNYFHLDGQTVLLEDYLEVRPERKVDLCRVIHEGKLNIGPWYVLQDEFLTSSEANIRNLYYGHRDCKNWGIEVTKIGYFPDSFGNMGQAPQILVQAGIETAAFGRGVKPTGFNNEISEISNFESPYSEMYWESPDGSRVLGILFANWYNNGMEIPLNIEESKNYWEKRIKDAQKFASTDELLFLNGCDHQPPQIDLPQAIETANRLYQDIQFIHSNFEIYINAIKDKIPETLQVVRGELRSQQTDGWYTLVNTASARVYLKQWNQLCQTLFEKVAEPIATMAKCIGYSYPHHLFEYGWKSLMKNHPHDSICGCSIDAVHREMVSRFEKSRDIALYIINEAKSYISSKLDTQNFPKKSVPFVVFNTSGYDKSECIEVTLDLEKIYFSSGNPTQIARSMRKIPFKKYKLIDTFGNEYFARISDNGVRFGYELPKDKFRQPYYARVAKVEFKTPLLSSFSTKCFAIMEGDSNIISSPLVQDNTLENEYIKAEVQFDGTINILDKVSKKCFYGLGSLENTGDIGNEYIYMQPQNDIPITTKGKCAKISIIESLPFKASIEVIHHMDVPIQMEQELFNQEKSEVLEFKFRNSRRSMQKITLRISVIYTIESNSRGIKVDINYDNIAKDCRMRILFPSGLKESSHNADSIFEVVKRNNFVEKNWKNPSNCQHQQTFVNVSNSYYGLTVANKGLNEYEIINCEDSIIAVTLLRSVSELGDWGVFDTPEAQCIGKASAQIMIIPHGSNSIESYKEAHNFQIPLVTSQILNSDGSNKEGTFLCWASDRMLFSNLKTTIENDTVIRAYSISNISSRFKLEKSKFGNLYFKSNILERVEYKCSHTIDVNPYEIITMKIKEG